MPLKRRENCNELLEFRNQIIVQIIPKTCIQKQFLSHKTENEQKIVLTVIFLIFIIIVITVKCIIN